MKKTLCKNCRFARRDPTISEKRWTAFECGNRESEYYRDLLNVSPSGDKQNGITWRGCKLGEERLPSLIPRLNTAHRN